MQAVVLVVLIVLNWLVYHKIFRVIYFGNMSKSLTGEFIWCAIAACIEYALFLALGEWIMGIVFTIALVVAAILAVREMYKFFLDVRGKFKKSETGQSVQLEKEKAQDTQVKFCISCGKQIQQNVKYCTFCGAKMDWK